MTQPAAVDSLDEIVVAEYAPLPGLNRKYFTAADLRRLSAQEFSSRRLAEGLFTGKHQTRQRGHSIEFQDYRQYIPGDPLPFLDWKVFGRTDKLYIKQFEHFADWTVHLVIDASRSMHFSGFQETGDSKYDAACRLAAAIGFLISKQHDRFSYGVARSGLYQYLPAKSGLGHLVRVLAAMELTSVAGTADLPRAIDQLMPLGKRRDVLCVFSDYLDSGEALWSRLKIWQDRGGEVVLFHLVHPDELDLPDVGALTFHDSETGETMVTETASIRVAYRERFQQFLESWAAQAARLGIDHRIVRTDRDYIVTLQQYFARRHQINRWQR